MKGFYTHTIRVTNFKETDFETLIKIFESGFLLSRNKLIASGDRSIEHSLYTVVYNGMDYISLCDLNKKHEYYSSYNMFTKRGLSLLIDHKIPVITPICIYNDKNIFYNIRSLALSEKRYTDFMDEVQVKNSISLEYLKGLSVSLSRFSSLHDQEYIEYYLKQVKAILNNYEYRVPIYDLDSGEKIKIK